MEENSELGEEGDSRARHSRFTQSTGGALAQTAFTILSVTQRDPSHAYTPFSTVSQTSVFLFDRIFTSNLSRLSFAVFCLATEDGRDRGKSGISSRSSRHIVSSACRYARVTVSLERISLITESRSSECELDMSCVLGACVRAKGLRMRESSFDSKDRRVAMDDWLLSETERFMSVMLITSFAGPPRPGSRISDNLERDSNRRRS